MDFGIIDNTSKDFRLDGTLIEIQILCKILLQNMLKQVILLYRIHAYNFLGQNDSGYIHIRHNHNHRVFGQGIISISYI